MVAAEHSAYHPPVGGDRELDLVLFGATSFVGRLTAEYLAGAAPGEVRIGLAGRSHERLLALRSTLGAPAAEWPLLVADTTDERSLAELAGRARAVATTVGPYRRYGLPVVEACATAGTHYADLNGEVLFMREAIDGFDSLAAERGARIVHSCGFDSIPSDLGVFLLHEAAAADGAGELEETTLVVRAMRGGFSGGTVASLTGTLDDVRGDGRLAELLTDPYGLSPDRAAEPDLGLERDMRGPHHDPELQMWIGPFIMGTINTRAVRRTNALLGWAYGRRFRYREVMGFGSGPLRGGPGCRHRGRCRRTGRCTLIWADARDARPGPSGTRRGPERGPARAGLLPHRDPHTNVDRSALHLQGGRQGRPGIQGDGGHVR